METSDRTSQEYQTALGINDWDYFLPRNHVNSPVEGKEYRIFQPQWKQIILFWLGRDDINSEEKEAFIQKLVDFDDGCGEWSYAKVDRGFYEYHAYLLAAAGINKFKQCSLSDEITEQIVKWVNDFSNMGKRKWITFLDLIKEGTRIVLSETIKEKVITNLIQVLETTEDESIRWNVAHSLGEIAVGNELAIQKLIQLLGTTKDESTRWNVAQILGKIAVGNELAIQALIRLLETTKFQDTRRRVADSLGEIAVGNELAIRELIRLLETTKHEDTRRLVSDSLGKIDPGNELAIRELIRLLETTKDKKNGWMVADSLGKIDPRNELAIRELIRLLKTTKYEDTRKCIADSLGEIAVGNELAIQELIRLLETTKNEDTRRLVVDILEGIAVGNELAIQELIQFLKTTNDEDTRRLVSDSLGKIAVGNELAIQELIQFLKTTNDEDTRRLVSDSLGKIAVGNELAIQELIRILETTKDESTRWRVAYSLAQIIKTEKQYADIVLALKHNLINEVYENNFDLFEKCYKLLWECAENLPYPKFYQAWHPNTLTPHPEITNNTPVEVLPTVRQLEQQITDISTQLSHLRVCCINVNKLLTLNIKNEIVQAFCNRLYPKLLPNETIPPVQTVTDLEREIIHLKQQLQTPHLFILLLADGTPTPEVIDCCDYLTDVLHLGWITPDPLPLPPPQRSFVRSQENLLAAVESWVAEY